MENELTLAEAACVPGPFVYGLKDQNGLFYIGRTRNPESRFSTYYDRAVKNQQWHLVRRLREAGEHLRVLVLHYRPENLNQAEADAISTHGGQLINVVANPYRQQKACDGSALRIRPSTALHQLPPCPACDGPMDAPKKPYCTSCWDKYIRSPSSAKARARALSELAKSA